MGNEMMKPGEPEAGQEGQAQAPAPEELKALLDELKKAIRGEDEGEQQRVQAPPLPRPPVIGDVIAINTEVFGKCIVEIVGVDEEANQLKTRIIGSDSLDSKPKMPIDKANNTSWETAGMMPFFVKQPEWDVDEIRAREMKRRAERGHALETQAMYTERDTEIIYGIFRNVIQSHIASGDVGKGLSFSSPLNLVLYRNDKDLLERLRSRLNAEVCQPVGFELMFLGKDMRRSHNIGFILEEREL